MEYQKRYDGMAKQLDSVQSCLDEISHAITKKTGTQRKNRVVP